MRKFVYYYSIEEFLDDWPHYAGEWAEIQEYMPESTEYTKRYSLAQLFTAQEEKHVMLVSDKAIIIGGR